MAGGSNGSAEGLAELDESGWGALIGWAAGPENLRRGPRQVDTARGGRDEHRQGRKRCGGRRSLYH
ncbi:DUF5956 family protein [Arthrobacter sp. ISL-65]|uniref:DUF5956 family protein n=1 Tax=Arthrobacter sp. ISL-65 TaxID=2819112 RepID=UPI0035A8B63F